jgi:hypothetical protein
VFNFPELADTREAMLAAFAEEQARTDLPPYRPKGMTPEGIAAFPGHVEHALASGNEMTLKNDLDFAPYWYASQAGADPGRFAKPIASSEFNTWYVLGLAQRLLDEGQEECRVVAAEMNDVRCEDCSNFDNKVVAVKEVVEGHRVHYHHSSPDRAALSVPAHLGCHHSIRRLD